jgi:(1->4)-alpha-D-glucan 1-alpha-D-glucosylmutase
VEVPEDGRIKLHVIRAALAARSNHPHLFAAGQYFPLVAEGPARDRLVAFARLPLPDSDASQEAAIVLVPRLTATLVSAAAAPVGEELWSDTVIHLPERLESRSWTCAITREHLPLTSGRSLAVGQVLRSFPVALLVSAQQRDSAPKNSRDVAQSISHPNLH